jgi:predicted dehydrogenase
MTDQGGIHMAVVGLGFGAEFVPIYLDHPDVASVAICDSDVDRLRSTAARFDVERTFNHVGEVVASADIDAVVAANWTAAGICAHESAMLGGQEVVVPNFD